MKRILVLLIVFVLLFASFNVYAMQSKFEGNTSTSGEIELKNDLEKTEYDNVLIGDVDGDKNINSIDLMHMRNYLLGNVDTFPVESGFYCADVDGNQKVDAIDLAYMRKYLLGMIEEFPKKTGSTDLSTPTPTLPTYTPTPTPPTSVPSPDRGWETSYFVGNVNVSNNPGAEIFVDKSSKTGVRVSAYTACKGPFYADGWLKTYFRLGGTAVNGVDYERIDFNYFWRVLGYEFPMDLGDDNPRREFYIVPIDTESDETKFLEIFFGDSSEPAATIYFVNSDDESLQR